MLAQCYYISVSVDASLVRQKNILKSKPDTSKTPSFIDGFFDSQFFIILKKVKLPLPIFKIITLTSIGFLFPTVAVKA